MKYDQITHNKLGRVIVNPNFVSQVFIVTLAIGTIVAD
jgi:hypothetical protein